MVGMASCLMPLRGSRRQRRTSRPGCLFGGAESLLEAFQTQALEAEQRHLLDFTAVPNDISHELKIEGFSMHERKFMLQPSYITARGPAARGSRRS